MGKILLTDKHVNPYLTADWIELNFNLEVIGAKRTKDGFEITINASRNQITEIQKAIDKR